MKHAILLLGLIGAAFACRESKPPPVPEEAIEREILAKGEDVVRALNEADIDLLLRDFLRSDSARFLIDGVTLRGYDAISTAFRSLPDRRKNLDLEVEREEVQVLSETVALHIVEFREEVTLVNDSSYTDRGVWSTLYRKRNGDWTLVMVHESHLPENRE